MDLHISPEIDPDVHPYQHQTEPGIQHEVTTGELSQREQLQAKEDKRSGRKKEEAVFHIHTTVVVPSIYITRWSYFLHFCVMRLLNFYSSLSLSVKKDHF